MNLYQPFERYLKEEKWDINQIIAVGKANSYTVRPTVDRWMPACRQAGTGV